MRGASAALRARSWDASLAPPAGRNPALRCEPRGRGARRRTRPLWHSLRSSKAPALKPRRKHQANGRQAMHHLHKLHRSLGLPNASVTDSQTGLPLAVANLTSWIDDTWKHAELNKGSAICACRSRLAPPFKKHNALGARICLVNTVPILVAHCIVACLRQGCHTKTLATMPCLSACERS